MRESEGVRGAGPERVWRLVCAVTDEGIRVVSRHRVEMTLPPADPFEDVPGTVGFWVELRDAEEHALYRRVMADPVEADIEVPGEPGDPSFTRVPAPPGGAFSVLVPDLPGADHVSLVRAEPADTRRAIRARQAEVARLPLTDESTAQEQEEEAEEEEQR
jgi:hypothetical protein